MGLSITTPGDTYSIKNTVISWSMAGVSGTQTGYELMWKLKNSGSWNTCGVINSSTNQASLEPIYNAAEVNGYSFKELHYRVKVTTTNNLGNGRIETGTWFSEAHNLIFKPTVQGILHQGATEIPLFSASDLNSSAIDKRISAKKPDGTVLQAPLLSTSHALRSPLRHDNRNAANSSPTFTGTGINANAYILGAVNYAYNYSGTAAAYDRTYSYFHHNEGYYYSYSVSYNYETSHEYFHDWVDPHPTVSGHQDVYYTYCSAEYTSGHYTSKQYSSSFWYSYNTYSYTSGYWHNWERISYGTTGYGGYAYGYYGVYAYNYYQYYYTGTHQGNVSYYYSYNT